MAEESSPFAARQISVLVIRGALLVAAFIGIAFFAYVLAVTENHLDTAQVIRIAVRSGDAPSAGWFGSNSALSIAFLILPQWKRTGRVDLVSMFGAVWALLWLAAMAWIVADLSLGYGDMKCVRPGCWPHGVQELLALAPAFLGGLAVLFLGISGTGVSWCRRAGRG